MLPGLSTFTEALLLRVFASMSAFFALYPLLLTLRFNSRLTVDGLLPRRSAILRMLSPCFLESCRNMRSSSVKCVYNIVVFSPVLVFVVINILQENVTMLFIYFSGVALRMIIHPVLPVPKLSDRMNSWTVLVSNS